MVMFRKNKNRKHPLHPLHPLILFDEKTVYPKEKEKSRCQVCNESRKEYTYRCYR